MRPHMLAEGTGLANQHKKSGGEVLRGGDSLMDRTDFSLCARGARDIDPQMNY